MQHEYWIKYYEGKYEDLASAIGDLRYDALAEFLGLLAQKIKQDGAKDAARGRKQLAACLEEASDNLSKSTQAIEEAWRISEPYMYPEDIRSKIQNEFSTKTEQQKAFTLLSAFYKKLGWADDPSFRLGRCLLFQTNGSLQEIQNNVELGLADPRDIMVQAEYDLKMNRLRNFNRPFGEEALKAEDLEPPSLPSSDDLPF